MKEDAFNPLVPATYVVTPESKSVQCVRQAEVEKLQGDYYLTIVLLLLSSVLDFAACYKHVFFFRYLSVITCTRAFDFRIFCRFTRSFYCFASPLVKYYCRIGQAACSVGRRSLSNYRDNNLDRFESSFLR